MFPRYNAKALQPGSPPSPNPAADRARLAAPRVCVTGLVLMRQRPGKLQRDAGVEHVVAEQIEDISIILDSLLDPAFQFDGTKAGDQP